jgi:hypothetical protein
VTLGAGPDGTWQPVDGEVRPGAVRLAVLEGEPFA